jgi:hypothetical protein
MKILLLLCLFLFSSVAFDVQRMEVLKGLRIVPPITDDDDDSNSANSPSICDAGDVDKDGIKDLLVGFASINTVYLLFGTTNSDLSSRYPDGVLNLTSAVSRGFALQFLGAPVSQLGYTVSSAGDVNNDGFADILLGAPGEGACYLVFGAAKEHMRVRYDSLFNFATGDFQDGIKFSSSNTVSKFGSALSHAGDFNGDGYQDFLIGAFAENTVYLVYGDTFLALQSRFGRDYTFGGAGQPFQTSMGMHWVGGSLSSVLGWSLSSAGDLNKDGFTDIIMGSFADSLCFIIFGAPVTALTSAWGSDFPLPLDTQTLNSSQVIQLVNQDEYSYFGWAVTACGDVNGDGYDDVAIGAWANARIFIFYGSANINTTNESVFYFQANNFPAERGLTVANSDPNSAFGLAIASIGDLDKDGYSDIIIGSHAEKTAYVLYGRASPTLTFNVSKSESENIPGKNSKRSFDVLLDSVISSSLGASVSSAGDFNNDTYADLLIKDTITGDTFLLFTSMNCSSSCLRCLESPSVCTMCVPTMPYLYRSQCYSSCPSGTFKSPINQCERKLSGSLPSKF